MWELIICVCLPMLLVGVVAARDEKYDLRLRLRAGQSWGFEQVFEGRQQSQMSAERQMPMSCAQSLRSVRKGNITVLAASEGVPAAIRVSFDPACATTLAQMGPEQSVPYPFAGRAVTVRRQADGRITNEIEGGMGSVVDMAAQQELGAYLYTNEGRPDHPVAVGEQWEPDLPQARRTYQLSGPDQVTGVSELVSVATINGQRAAEVRLCLRIVKHQGEMVMTEETKGSIWLDLESGRLVQSQLHGVSRGEGIVLMPGPFGAPVRTSIANAGQTQMRLTTGPDSSAGERVVERLRVGAGAPNEREAEAPAGYVVAATTAAGKRLATNKSAAPSLLAALVATLTDLAGWFDARLEAVSACVDARQQQWAGAPFTARLKGRPVKGLVVCTAGQQGGADISVTYCQADAPALEWSKLTAGAAAADATAPTVPMSVYCFPDGTGSIQLPAGWRTAEQTAAHGVRVEGPAGQIIGLDRGLSITTPDSPLAQRPWGFLPQTQQMLVAPFTGPVEAMQNLFPQFSQSSEGNGGPAIELEGLLEAPRPATPVRPNGQAAEVYFAFTKRAGGTASRYRSRAAIETFPLAPGTWMYHVRWELAAPDGVFDRDWPVMVAIARSYQVNPAAIRQASAQAVAELNARFQAGQRMVRTMQRNFEVSQQSIASTQQVFDGCLQSLQSGSDMRSFAGADFAEAIRGERTVMDTLTGERGMAALGNVDDIVEELNRADPGRYIQIPLRYE